MHNNKVVNIIGWIIAILSTALYTLTQYPTISFWDGAEFVATSSTLQIPHPPGAPFFQLLGSIIPLTYLMPIFSGLSVMMFHLSPLTVTSRPPNSKSPLVSVSRGDLLHFIIYVFMLYLAFLKCDQELLLLQQ